MKKPLSEILGRPGEGIHRHYGFGFAIWDVVMTVVVSLAINYKNPISGMTILTFITMFLVGQFAHLAFGVQTEFIKLIL